MAAIVRKKGESMFSKVRVRLLIILLIVTVGFSVGILSLMFS